MKEGSRQCVAPVVLHPEHALGVAVNCRSCIHLGIRLSGDGLHDERVSGHALEERIAAGAATHVQVRVLWSSSQLENGARTFARL